MGLLMVDAQVADIPTSHTDTSKEDLLVVTVSVTDANGNPRDGLTTNSVTFSLLGGNLTGGTVDDFVTFQAGSGFYGLEFGAGPADANGAFPSFPNADSTFGVAIADGGDNGQTIVRITVTGR